MQKQDLISGKLLMIFNLLKQDHEFSSTILLIMMRVQLLFRVSSFLWMVRVVDGWAHQVAAYPQLL